MKQASGFAIVSSLELLRPSAGILGSYEEQFFVTSWFSAFILIILVSSVTFDPILTASGPGPTVFYRRIFSTGGSRPGAVLIGLLSDSGSDPDPAPFFQKRNFRRQRERETVDIYYKIVLYWPYQEVGFT